MRVYFGITTHMIFSKYSLNKKELELAFKIKTKLNITSLSLQKKPFNVADKIETILIKNHVQNYFHRKLIKFDFQQIRIL